MSEEIFYYSKVIAWIHVLLLSVAFVATIMLIVSEDLFSSILQSMTVLSRGSFVALTNVIILVFFALILPPALIYFGLLSGKKALDGNPQLRISKQGIWAKKYGFYQWKDIDNIERSTRGLRFPETFLKIQLTEGATKEIHISELKNWIRIVPLVDTYKKTSIRLQGIRIS